MHIKRQALLIFCLLFAWTSAARAEDAQVIVRGSPQTRRVAFIKGVHHGAIIIFHDGDEYGGADRTETVAALKIILPALQARGYEMVRLPNSWPHPHPEQALLPRVRLPLTPSCFTISKLISMKRVRR